MNSQLERLPYGLSPFRNLGYRRYVGVPVKQGRSLSRRAAQAMPWLVAELEFALELR